MLNFKPKEFLDVMKEIRDELRAVRKLLEDGAAPQYFITTPSDDWRPTWGCFENEDSSDASWKRRTKVEEDET